MTSNDNRLALDAANARRIARDAALTADTWMPTTVRRLPPKNRSRSGKRRIIR